MSDMENINAQPDIEQIRQEALKQYDQASAAIHNWSSFIEKAIKNYHPDKIYTEADRKQAFEDGRLEDYEDWRWDDYEDYKNHPEKRDW